MNPRCGEPYGTAPLLRTLLQFPYRCRSAGGPEPALMRDFALNQYLGIEKEGCSSCIVPLPRCSGLGTVGQVRRRVIGQLFSPVRDGQGRAVTISEQQYDAGPKYLVLALRHLLLRNQIYFLLDATAANLHPPLYLRTTSSTRDQRKELSHLPPEPDQIVHYQNIRIRIIRSVDVFQPPKILRMPLKYYEYLKRWGRVEG